MEEAHHTVLMLEGTGLHDGAHQDLDQTAADGIEHHRNEKAPEGDGDQLRQEGHGHQAHGGQQLGRHHTGTVSDFVGESGGRKVDEQLGEIKNHGDHGDFFKGDPIGAPPRCG